jgi:hypothetical protein
VCLGCSNGYAVKFERVSGQSIAERSSNFPLKALDLVGVKLDHGTARYVDQVILVLTRSRSIPGGAFSKCVPLDHPEIS